MGVGSNGTSVQSALSAGLAEVRAPPLSLSSLLLPPQSLPRTYLTHASVCPPSRHQLSPCQMSSQPLSQPPTYQPFSHPPSQLPSQSPLQRPSRAPFSRPPSAPSSAPASPSSAPPCRSTTRAPGTTTRPCPSVPPPRPLTLAAGLVWLVLVVGLLVWAAHTTVLQ